MGPFRRERNGSRFSAPVGQRPGMAADNRTYKPYCEIISFVESRKLERVMGIEPTLVAWEATVLPLNYTRSVCLACALFFKRLDHISSLARQHVPQPIKTLTGPNTAQYLDVGFEVVTLQLLGRLCRGHTQRKFE
jgi:hypothetical protein